MLKSFMGSIAIALIALAVAPVSRASDAEVIRESRDRADIEVLIWKYVQALDNLDDAAYPTFFTADGSICCEHDHTFKGRAEIRQLLVEVKEKRAQAKAKGEVVPKTYHPIFN